MSISNVIALLSGVALFLFGMELMGDGLKKVAGSRLEVILYKLSGTPLKGFLLGTGVTAVIQSSSATSVMVVGFVNSGMMKLRQAISIVMGAILGTSITGWVICMSYIEGGGTLASLLSTATLTGLISVVGILLRMFSKSQAKKHIGDILMGFAVLMFGMSAMSGAVAPLRQSETFTRFLTTFSNPMLGILFGAAFTCVLQSASAAVGIVQALSASGVLDGAVALPIIMGIAIGAAFPVMLSAMGATADGKRTALVYLVVEVVGVAVVAIPFYIANFFFNFSFMQTVMTPVSVAFINTVFRLVKVLLLLPFVDAIESLVKIFVKDGPASEEEREIMRLEERFIQHPALAIEQSRQTINAMASEAHSSFSWAISLLDAYSEDGFKKTEQMEKAVDVYEDKLGSYLVKLTGRELTKRQNEDISKFLHTLSDFERISDHALNVAEAARELYEKNVQFSDEAKAELSVLVGAIGRILNLSIHAFMQNDIAIASQVEPLEQVVDELCDEMKMHHVERLQRGVCTLAQGFIFNDLLTNFERVADHCSNIAVAVIELDDDAFDTHAYLGKLKEMKNGKFEEYYQQYSSQFRI